MLTEEFGAVSHDFVDSLFRLESKFGHTQATPLDRIGERFGPGALSGDGVLAELGGPSAPAWAAQNYPAARGARGKSPG